MIEDAKRQAKVEAHSSLGNEAKRIAGENKRMAKELRFQMQVWYHPAEGGGSAEPCFPVENNWCISTHCIPCVFVLFRGNSGAF